MKNKLFLLISMITLLALIGTAATCSMCGINFSSDTTVSDTKQGKEDFEETTEMSETAGGEESTSAEETIAEDTSQAVGDIGLVDNSMVVAVFAIANEPGDQLITFYSDADEAMLEDINGAIGEDGQFYEIEYVNRQDSNNQDSGRVTSDNFNNMEGYLYRTAGENLVPNNTYYLCNSEIINKDNLLETEGLGVEVLDEETKTQIEDIKGRSVQEGWIIDEYSDGTQILIAVFEPDGENLLMSIVLKVGDTLKFIDYPAVFDGYSAWRVDDGGNIDPALFSILFTTLTTDGFLTVISWAGAEGENTSLLLENADALIKLPAEIYRYWSAV